MMKIGELAGRANVSVDTLRLYEKRGLIRSERMANGYRVFASDMVRIVGLIKQGQRLGFTLGEMSEIVSVMTSADLPADQVSALLEAKISEVDKKISELSEIRQLLEVLHKQSCPLRTQA